jgi:hypothetical protein
VVLKMTTPATLHPLAQHFLANSKEFGYILAIPLCREMARRSPLHCVTWAHSLVEAEITRVADRVEVADALTLVREGLANPNVNLLSRLDEAASRVWACNCNCNSAPIYTHRAASGLVWATMAAIIATSDLPFDSQHNTMKCNAEGAVAIVARESERALGIVFSTSAEGWLKVAQAFTLEMEKYAESEQ